MKIQCKVKGISPYIMHKFVVEESTTSRAKKVYDPVIDAEKVTYRNDEGKLVIPSAHFKAAMVKAGTDFKMTGRKTYKEYIKSGVMFDDIEILLDQQKYEVYSCPVVIQRARIMRSRPMIKDWSCTFTFEITDEMMNQTVVKEILEAAGKYKGVGDNRPEFGRFEVTEFKKLD